MIPIVVGVLGTIPKRIIKGTGKLVNKRESKNYPNYSIVNIGLNTEKSPGYLRRFTFSQTREKPPGNVGVKNFPWGK